MTPAFYQTRPGTERNIDWPSGAAYGAGAPAVTNVMNCLFAGNAVNCNSSEVRLRYEKQVNPVPMSKPVEVAIVIPCLNQAETLPACIAKARRGLQAAGVAGEILVADNGSTDSSRGCGASRRGCLSVTEKGYGSALRGGIEAAQSKWIIMGDADDSYDFSRIDGMVQKLRAGFDLVMGCRFPSGSSTILYGRR